MPLTDRRPVALNHSLLAALLLGWSLLIGAPPTHAAAVLDPGHRQSELRACLVCHQMETIAYRDPATGNIRDLYIDPDRYASSDHAGLACTGCHRTSFRRYPHRHASADEDLKCVGCHDDDPKSERLRFKEIAAEFDRSVHRRRNPDAPLGSTPLPPLSCHSCHDAHVFRAARRGDDLAAIVQDQNRACLSCHAGDEPAMAERHAWLPNRALHWQAVRCLDCHTPDSAWSSHDILPAAQAVRHCVECHSRDATLLNQLYAYRAQEGIAQQGFINLAVFNHAYVVGMSRNRTIDRLALALIGLTLAGLAAHGIGRFRAYRAYRSNRNET